MRMTHDAVEDPIEVPEISVRHYERSGWKVADHDRQPVTTTAPAARRGRKEERDS